MKSMTKLYKYTLENPWIMGALIEIMLKVANMSSPLKREKGLQRLRSL